MRLRENSVLEASTNLVYSTKEVENGLYKGN